MDNINTYQHIAHLILKQQTNCLNAQETEELNDWLAENDTHKALYKKILAKHYSKDIEFYDSVNTSEAWKKYVTQYPHKQKTKKIALWYMAAACFIGIFVLSVTFFIHPPSNNILSLNRHAIQPGSSKAILVLHNGESLDLTSTENNHIATSGTTQANNTGSQISYTDKENAASSEEEKDVFNEIIIPRGGEYKIILADGTRVWLNSQTKLKYPVKFTQGVRQVYLTGEAFFEVTPNAKKPFLVQLENNVTVRVLGTSFNVRAYNDEETTETVLEKGIVKAESAAGSVTLSPSFMFEYNKKAKTISERRVDTELYTAWKDGRYVFYNEPIENILHKLSRWYNINIAYKDETVKKLPFSGNVRKYENVNTLLEAFETSGGIHFDIRGNNITVSRLKK